MKINPREASIHKKEVHQVDEAYIFDVDGPVSDPNKKRPTIEENLDAIAEKIAKNEPVAFNTGRSLSWMIERVITPLILKVKDRSTLQNFFAVGEKGGTWLTFDEGEQMTEHKDDSISFPSKLSKQIRQLVDSEFSKTTFFDDSKLTMASTEMIDGFSDEEREERYRPDQQRLVTRLNEMLIANNLAESFKVDPTTIATDVENKHVGKDFAVRRILNWLREKKVAPAEFIAFGDSISDIPMAEEIQKHGLKVRFVYVGEKPVDFSKYSFPVTETSAKYESGTLEFLNSK